MKFRIYSIAVALLATVVVFGNVACAPALAEPLPKQIDDDTFWRLLTEFSESGGSFTSENFVSNGPNFQLVLTRLKAAAEPGSTLDVQSHIRNGCADRATFLSILFSRRRP